MPMEDAEVKELKTLLEAAKKSPVNFGLCFGKAPEDTVIKLNKIKEGKSLAATAKKAAGGSQICFGSASSESGKLTLTCEVKPPSEMAKKVQSFLRGHGLSLTVKLGDGDDAKPEAGADAPHPDTGKWQKELADFSPQFDGSVSRMSDAASQRAVWEFALSSAEDGNIPAARQALAKVKTAVDKFLPEFAEGLALKLAKQIKEVAAGISDTERGTLRGDMDKILKTAPKLTAAVIDERFAALTKSLDKIVKETTASTKSTLDTEHKALAAKILKSENAIKKLLEDVTKLENQVAETARQIKEVNTTLNGPKRPPQKKAQQMSERLVTLRETLVTQQTAATNRAKEIEPLVAELEKTKTKDTQDVSALFANIQNRLDGLKRSVPDLPFKDIQDKLKDTIGEMAEATVWREGQEGQGGELRRNAEGGSHGSARHGAQTGVERQARRSATGGIAPDGEGDRESGVTTHIKEWNGATIEWEVVGGKRKVKSRTPVQKKIVEEVGRSTMIPADGSTSIFATPVLEKLAVDTAVKLMNGKGWTEVYSSSKSTWKALTSVAVYLGPPSTYGKPYKGWGYSLTRKEVATMALDKANEVLTRFEKGEINEAKMLDELGVEYLMKDGLIAMVPYVRVILTRPDGAAKWTSLTHYPDKSLSAEGLDIAGRKVRNARRVESTAAF